MKKNIPQQSRFQKDFDWLREVHALDSNSEKVLRALLRRHKRFLVVGNHQSGKNTVADVVSGHLHESGKEPLILPTLESRTLDGVLKSANWKNYQKIMEHGYPVVLAVGHGGRDPHDSGEEFFRKLANRFDVLIDIRRMQDGSRVLCQIFAWEGDSFRCVYRSKSVEFIDWWHRAA